MPSYPMFIGYGTLGISSESGKVEGDTGDLVVLRSNDQWKNIDIFYFARMGNINDMGQVMRFLDNYVSEEVQLVEQEKGDASQQDPSDWITND